MRVVDIHGDSSNDDEFFVSMTVEEIKEIRSAIVDALDEVEEWEFHTLIGGTPEEARALVRQIDEVLRQVGSAE